MAAKKQKPVELGAAGIKLGTGGILAIAAFLLVWNIVELGTGTGPKGAPPGTTYHAANQAGATVMPSDRPSVLDQ